MICNSPAIELENREADFRTNVEALQEILVEGDIIAVEESARAAGKHAPTNVLANKLRQMRRDVMRVLYVAKDQFSSTAEIPHRFPELVFREQGVQGCLLAIAEHQGWAWLSGRLYEPSLPVVRDTPDALGEQR